MSKQSPNGGGIGFNGLLTIVLIALKLTNHIDWSWWLVLSPLLFSLFFSFVIILVTVLLKHIKKWKNE
jgi:hypothetical protein